MYVMNSFFSGFKVFHKRSQITTRLNKKKTAGARRKHTWQHYHTRDRSKEKTYLTALSHKGQAEDFEMLTLIIIQCSTSQGLRSSWDTSSLWDTLVCSLSPYLLRFLQKKSLKRTIYDNGHCHSCPMWLDFCINPWWRSVAFNLIKKLQKWGLLLTLLTDPELKASENK